MEESVGTLTAVFAALAIFISCMGIFGMASFMAEQRIREIGIRKVLGASVPGLWYLLSREFVLLVLSASAIAIPLSCFAMSRWLESYSYRTTLAWWVFACAGIGAITIALLTVSFQTIRAARTNPVHSLKLE